MLDTAKLTDKCSNEHANGDCEDKACIKTPFHKRHRKLVRMRKFNSNNKCQLDMALREGLKNGGKCDLFYTRGDWVGERRSEVTLLRTDFKFIGKVESQTNNFLKNSVLAYFT